MAYVRPNSAGERSPLVFVATLSLLGSLLVAGIALARPFSHAAWLAAYLFLVGFLSQALLARGQAALAGPRGTANVPLQAALWNAGVIAVPIGVFTDARLWVVLGGLTLLAALISFWRTTTPIPLGRNGPGRLQAAYILLIAAMALSSFIGIGLAWHRPWL
jgi:hypothetical protein